MLYGYAGKILRVNLTTGNIAAEPLAEEMARDYIGGRGFAANILYREIPPGADPLSPENKVVVAAGPLSGLFLPGSGKITFASKSPATGGYGDSNMGGHMASELKFAGYDAIIIEGAAQKPSYLYIDDDEVEIRDASKYWGKGAMISERMILDDLSEDFRVATIGPAGENLVKYACVSHDFGRQSGRTGIAAVLGSKKVKAIAIRGSQTIPVPDPAKLFEVGGRMYEICFAKPGFKEWTPDGTAGVTDWANQIGAFPTRNFWTGYFEAHKNINGQALSNRIKVLDKGCFGCPIPCGKYSKVEMDGKSVNVEGPEYESIALLGGNLMLDSIEKVAYANYVCDELGLDTISAGNVIAFAMECLEKGVITKEQVGQELRWGSLDDAVKMMQAIANREGIGDVLAEGVRYAAEKFGGGSEKYAIHVKGLEWSGYEARYAPSMMLAYITCDLGGHHNRAWSITHDVATGRDSLEGKADKVIELQHVRPMFDNFGVCRLQWVEIGFELDHYIQLIETATGYHYSWEDLMKVSERVWNLTRSFSLREISDFGRKYDYPPARFMEEPMPTGPAKGKYLPREQIDTLLDEYYDKRGWNREGKPKRATLDSLKLGFVADELAWFGRL